MRISDWSSDVCSSDLIAIALLDHAAADRVDLRHGFDAGPAPGRPEINDHDLALQCAELGAGRTLQDDAGRLGRLLADLDGRRRRTDREPEQQREPGAEHATVQRRGIMPGGRRPASPRIIRSEEHTSELQSLMRNSYDGF